MKKRLGLIAGLVAMSAAVAFAVGPSYSRHDVAKAFDPTTMPEIQERLFDETSLTFDSTSGNDTTPSQYFPKGSNTCSTNLSSNIKVNQNCLNVADADLQGRSQAQNETSIAVDPMNTNNLVASSNDYRRGDGSCYSEYSSDGGRTWNDTTLPNNFVRGRFFGAARQYFQASGDPSVAFDTKGNAYYSCQMFQRGSPTTPNPDLSSAVYVFRSTGNGGASWNFPGRPVIESSDVTGSGIPAFEDKPYMTVDNHVGSPFQDRIYVAYTEFASDGSAYIWESYSNDYGEHFSPRHLVSINSPLCVITFGLGTPNGNCNENQFADPFTGPDGALYIAFQNFNNATTTATDNRNQILLVKSTDGGNTFSAPIKVADWYDLPDCATYQGGQDFGRACVPEQGASQRSVFRATNYPSGAVNPTNPSQVIVTFGSYINPHSNESTGCIPAGTNPATGDNQYSGVKTPACNNDILLSVSNNGGATFTGTATDPRALTPVTQDPGQAISDQWWQWAGYTKNGKLAVSYYDRQYGDDETSANMDVSLSGSGDLTSFNTNRVTSSSMPVPTQFPDARGNGTFFGDYTGLAVATNANPLWMDTRNPDIFLCPGTATPTTPPGLCTGTEPSGSVANDQDIYTANLSVPSK
jgi:hypothetical protein